MSVIYKIYCLDENIKDCYIGSTNDLIRRISEHKKNCNNINSRNYNFKVYNFIRANGGYINWDFEILETFNTIDKQDLFKIEGQYIKNNYSNLNSKVAGRTHQEYYEDNKKHLQTYYKNYYEDNKQQIKEQHKIYYENNKIELNEQSKKYREDNKQQIKETRKIHYEKNKIELNEKKQKYYEENKIEINEKQKEKIICEFCKLLIRKANIKRHQKTKKCLDMQS